MFDPEAKGPWRPNVEVVLSAHMYKEFRLAMGMTQKELAEYLGVWPNTVARREQGQLKMTMEAALAIKYMMAQFKGDIKWDEMKINVETGLPLSD